ncbi:MAG: GHKL domain-containing protein [Oscillospiraceae bacterium]|nr:GHKL domain-containing protein [Oscillospiraceae bacterium]
MTTHDFFRSLLSWYVLFPAAALCLAPMWNQMKQRRRTFLLGVPLLCALAAAVSLLEAALHAGYNTFSLPLLAACFLAYHRSLRVHIVKSFAVFALVSALFGFLANFANGFDAYLHPNGTLDDFSVEAALFQAGVCTLAAALLFCPMKRFGTRMVDRFDDCRVWLVTVPVSGIFLAYNLLIAPRRYETAHVNHVFQFYWFSLTLLLLLLCLLCVLFYFIVSVMLESTEVGERNRLLELQKAQYHAQMRYFEDSARARHDFRHTIHTLRELSREKKYADLDAYLERYAAALPVNEFHRLCDNEPLNALLNHYLQTAVQSGISLRLKLELPEQSGVADVDLCGVVGNILDNALAACSEPGSEPRQISLAVTAPFKNCVCIVASNSFNGRVNQKDGRYLSTHHDGAGLGLASIVSTAERYGGTAQFRHEGSIFYSSVMLMTANEKK